MTVEVPILAYSEWPNMSTQDDSWKTDEISGLGLILNRVRVDNDSYPKTQILSPKSV